MIRITLKNSILSLLLMQLKKSPVLKQLLKEAEVDQAQNLIFLVEKKRGDLVPQAHKS